MTSHAEFNVSGEIHRDAVHDSSHLNTGLYTVPRHQHCQNKLQIQLTHFKMNLSRCYKRKILISVAIFTSHIFMVVSLHYTMCITILLTIHLLDSISFLLLFVILHSLSFISPSLRTLSSPLLHPHFCLLLIFITFNTTSAFFSK